MDEHLYTVSLTIPSLSAENHREAAEVFVRVLVDWIGGELDTLTLDVTDEHTNAYHMVEIRAAEVR